MIEARKFADGTDVFGSAGKEIECSGVIVFRGQVLHCDVFLLSFISGHDCYDLNWLAGCIT